MFVSISIHLTAYILMAAEYLGSAFPVCRCCHFLCVHIYKRKPKQMLIITFFYFLTWLDSPFRLTSCAPLKQPILPIRSPLLAFFSAIYSFYSSFSSEKNEKRTLRQRYCFNNFLIYFSFFQQHKNWRIIVILRENPYTNIWRRGQLFQAIIITFAVLDCRLHLSSFRRMWWESCDCEESWRRESLILFCLYTLLNRQI